MADPAARSPEATGLAIATLALGVVALVLSPLLLGVPLAVAGLLVALAYARQRPARRGMLWWGAGLSLAGLLVGIACGALYYRLYTEWRGQWASHDEGDEDGGPDWAGVRAPALKFTTLEGEAVDLAQFAGRPVVLTFWATWCGPCRAEIPHLERLAREVPEVAVLGVSDEPETTLREFTEKKPIAYRVASVPNPPAPFDGVQSLPTTVFVDRKGVIREVYVGLQDFDELRTRALAPDYTGDSRSAEVPAVEAGAQLAAKERWTAAVVNGRAMATCNWDEDPAHELLVQDGASVLHVFDAAGGEKTQITLAERFGFLDCANAADGSVRLLGYTHWGPSITVLDAAGRALWSYPAPAGVNGAHWGDLDGDGDPEIVAGFNGDGGLHAVTSGGRRLWKVTSIGNVWTQSVLPAAEGREAVVAATEAGGTVRLFDGEGSQTAELRPLGDYYTAVDVSAAEPPAPARIVAAGQKRVLAFDASGTVAWQLDQKPQKRHGYFARGNLAGDAATEMVFPAKARQLQVVSASGARIAEIDRAADASFVVLPAAKGPGLLIVLEPAAVRAYVLEPPPS
jgi:thiol-disulfide isomerase/thioredoxin